MLSNLWKGLVSVLLLTALAIPAAEFYFPRAQAQVGKPIYCTASAFYDAADNGNIQVIAAPTQSTGAIYVCGYVLLVGTNAANVGWTYGTGTNCATGNTKITPAWNFPANGGLSEPVANFAGMYLPIGKALCISSSTGVLHQARVSYAIVF